MLSKEDNGLLTHTGPGTPMGNLFRRFWLPALVPSEVPLPDSPPIRFRILGEDLIAFRDTSGRVGFVANACPHRGASMFFGRNEEDGLRCVYHGWKFDVSGACVDMPSEPAESNFRNKVRIRSYPSAERGGLVWIYMGPGEPPPLPDYEWCMNDYPDLHVYKWMQESNFAQGLEGNIDTSHSAFLHRAFHNGNSTGSYMRGGSPDTSPQLQIFETEFGFVYGGRRNRPDGQYYWRIYGYVWPTFISIAAPTWDGAATIVIPQDDEHSWWFAVSPQGRREGGKPGTDFVELEGKTWRQTNNRDNDYGIDREAQRTVNFTGLFGNRVQDAAVTESMGNIYDRSKEHLGTSDLAVIFMRRNLIKQARLLAQGIEPKLPSNATLFRVRPIELVTPEPELGSIWERHHGSYTPGYALAPSVTT